MFLKEIKLKNGVIIPRLGQGTWFMGEDKSKEKEEIAALKTGIELGMTLIDTAEMYGEGASEALIGKAIRGYNREKLYLVSKVYPHNAGKNRIEKSLDNSLKRLGVEYLDTYILHWRGSVPLEETVEEMERLVRKGKIKSWGVSNLDIYDMEELFEIPKGDNCIVNQVLYHLGSRGVEFSLLPWLKDHEIPLMAYCPMAQGGTLRSGIFQNPAVERVCKERGITPAQLLLNFVLQDDGVFAIPKAGTSAHVEENFKALDFSLNDEEIETLNMAFPKPNRKTYLDIV